MPILIFSSLKFIHVADFVDIQTAHTRKYVHSTCSSLPYTSSQEQGFFFVTICKRLLKYRAKVKLT